MNVTDPIIKDIIESIKSFNIKKLCNMYPHNKFHWKITGSSTISKVYLSKSLFFQEVVMKLQSYLLPKPSIDIKKIHITDDIIILQCITMMRTKDNKNYNNEYCWIIKIYQGHITSIISYLDTLLIENIFNKIKLVNLDRLKLK